MQPTHTKHSIGTTPIKVLEANAARKYLCIQNKAQANEAVVSVKVDGRAFIVAESGSQKVTFASAPTAGSFKLQLGAQVTSAIQHNAVYGDVQTALEALSNIGSGNVTVTGDFATGFAVVFKSALANTPVAALEVVQSSLVNTALRVPAVHVIRFAAPPTAGTWRLTWMEEETADLASDISAAQLKTALELLSDFGAPSDITSITQDSGTKAFTITVAAGSSLGEFTVTENQLVTAASEASSVQKLYAGPAPVSGSFKLMHGSELTAAIPYDVTAADLEAILEDLPSVDVGNVAVTGSSLLTGFTITQQGALANHPTLELVPTSNTLEAFGNVGHEVKLLVQVQTPGQAPVAVIVTPAITTAGSNADGVVAEVEVLVAGSAQGNEGLEIDRDADKTWATEVPTEAVWVVSNEANTPVEVVEG